MSNTQLRPINKQPATKSDRTINNFLQISGILPILVLTCILFSVLSPNFLTPGNIVNIFRQASVNIVLATGMTFVILTGGIDLSVGSILAVSAVASLIVSLIPGLGWAAVIAGLLTGLALGLLNGALIALLDVPFYCYLGFANSAQGRSILNC